MFIVKILKRKDAASVLLAVVVAMIIGEFLTIVTPLSIRIVGMQGRGYGPGSDWKSEYLMPLVTAVLELIALEIVVRLYVYAAAAFKRK